MFGNRALAGALLGMAGVLLAHEVSYRISGAAGLADQTFVPHGHLGVLWAVTWPVAAIGISFLAVRQTRRLRLDRPLGVPTLSMAIIAAFLALEITEHLRSGVSLVDTLSSATTIGGVLASVPVAWFLSRATSAAAEVIEAVVDALREAVRRVFGGPARVPALVPVRESEPRPVRRDAIDPRGPPSMS